MQTPPPNVYIREAGVRDLDAILRILSDGAQRMSRLGVGAPWPDPFPHERVMPLIDAGAVFIVTLDGNDEVGTFILAWDADPYWDGYPQHPAGYLHRLAILQRVAGRRVTAPVLGWVFARTLSEGRTHVRLDCLEGARQLRAYYESFGFRHVGDVRVRGFALALYERELSARARRD